MAAKKKTAKPKTRYLVCSRNTGATICGPYDSRKDADRECARLNEEALSGIATARRANELQPLAHKRGAPITHRGQVQRYEVTTEKGLVV